MEPTETEIFRAFVNRAIPDASTRSIILTAFADAILRANQLSASSWALTLPRNRNEEPTDFRLIVSSNRTLVIGQSAFWIMLEIEQFKTSFPDLASLESQGIALDRKADYVIGLGVPYREAATWLERLKPWNDQLIDISASSVRTRSHRFEYHQQAGVTYLNEELGMDLPQPSYIAPTSTANWWIERTTSDGWPIRQSGEWSVGKTIFFWPEKIAAGQVQSQMQEGDVVLHLTNRKAFTCISRVKSAWKEQIPPPEDSGWNLDSVVVTRLENNRDLTPALELADLFTEPYAARLMRLPTQGHKNLFYKTRGGLGLWGNGFLTPVPGPLLDILRDAYRAQTGKELVPEGWPMPETVVPPPISELVALTHMPAESLMELVGLLEDKKQLILEGPPGAGKTFLADLLARWIADAPLDGAPDERVELVQFHQSYGYEDFVQGLRPVTENGAVVFKVVDGIFLDLCKRAAADPDQPYVLIIDEINRGNLSRIFGELLMALEYRDKPVRMPYGGEQLNIPANLYLIGTMNTTDRSLALVDYALRRRFYFHRLQPVEGGAAPVYARWLASRGFPSSDQDRLHRLFVALNSRIASDLTPDFQVGHSYFMRDDIHEPAGLHRVWKHAVTPLLHEYFHTSRNRDQVLDTYTLEKMLAEASRQARAASSFGGDSDGEPDGNGDSDGNTDSDGPE